MATAQLQLTTAPREWKLDERTIEIGRVGLAQARAALAQAEATPTLLPTDSELTPTIERSRSGRQRSTKIIAGQGALALFDEQDEHLLAA